MAAELGLSAPEFRKELLNTFDAHYEILCLSNEQGETPTPEMGEVIDNVAQCLAAYLGIGEYKGQTKDMMKRLLRAYTTAIKNLFPEPVFTELDRKDYDKLTKQLDELFIE